MEFVKINFTPDRIKYILFNNIKKIVFENNGIIFGGFVRDMIISNHYKTIYNNHNKYDIHKFWNKFYQPETAARALVARDMDICMYSEDDISNFLTALQDVFNTENGYSNISSSILSVSDSDQYFNLPIKMHKKINYTVTVEKIPFVHTGIEMSFDFDIIIPINTKISPPFNKLDFLSNVFILTNYGISISNNTGTIIDTMSILQKQKITNIIMNSKVLIDIPKVSNYLSGVLSLFINNGVPVLTSNEYYLNEKYYKNNSTMRNFNAKFINISINEIG